MYNEQQIEDMKRRVREQDTKVFDIWLNQYDDHNYYTKEEEDRYDRE